MVSDPNLAGYLVYLAAVFVPGLGFAELLRPWGDGDGLAERLGYVLGIGFSVDTILFAVKTSGLRIGGVRLVGISSTDVYLVIALGVAALAVSLLLRKKAAVLVAPGATEAWLILVSASLALLCYLYFLKYPIFPISYFPDLSHHLAFVQNLISGSQSTFPRGILYFGAHYQLAIGLVAVGGLPIVTAQTTMALMIVFSPLIVFLAARRIFTDRAAALGACALYAFTGVVWFFGALNTSLYANFFGILMTLYFIATLVDVSGRPSASSWAVFLTALGALYFSHYTSLTIIPAVCVLLFLQFLGGSGQAKRLLLPLTVLLAPIAIVVVFYFQLIHLMISLAYQPANLLQPVSPVSLSLGFFPVLQYAAVEFMGDVGFIILLALAAVCVWYAVVNSKVLFAIPVLWLAFLMGTSPLDSSAWRFSYEALVPLVLMAGQGLFVVVQKVQNYGPLGSIGHGRMKAIIILLLVLTPVFLSSAAGSTAIGSLNGTSANAQAQRYDYDAMTWLGQNTPANAIFLSVTDVTLQYSDAVISRPTNFSVTESPSLAIQMARQDRASYIIVTRTTSYSTVGFPGSQVPWDAFGNYTSSSIKLVYENPGVHVYEVIP